MSIQVEEDKRTSSDVFSDLVFPKIKTAIDGEFVISVEKNDSKIAEVLDRQSGIDVIVQPTNQNKGPIPIAHRVNKNKFATFTLGKTELEKLKNNLGGESMSPAYTCQSIIAGQVKNELVNAAIISTKELVKYVENGEEGEPDHSGDWVTTKDGDYYWQKRDDGTGEFCCVSWLDIREWTDKMEIVYLDHAGNMIDNTVYLPLHRR